MAEKRRRVGIDFKNLFLHGVESECEDLQQFIETMQSAIARKQKDFDSFVSRKAKGLSDEARDEVYDWYSDEAGQVYSTFPQLLWNAVFTSLFGYFEQEMNSYCRRIRSFAKSKNIPLVAIPTGQDQLVPGQKCLQSCGIRLPLKSREWKKFQIYVPIRNLIVHNHALLRPNDDNADQVRAFIAKENSITISRFGHVVLNKEFCEEALNVIRKILTRTLTAIPGKLLRRA